MMLSNSSLKIIGVARVIGTVGTAEDIEPEGHSYLGIALLSGGSSPKRAQYFSSASFSRWLAWFKSFAVHHLYCKFSRESLSVKILQNLFPPLCPFPLTVAFQKAARRFVRIPLRPLPVFPMYRRPSESTKRRRPMCSGFPFESTERTA